MEISALKSRVRLLPQDPLHNILISRGYNRRAEGGRTKKWKRSCGLDNECAESCIWLLVGVVQPASKQALDLTYLAFDLTSPYSSYFFQSALLQAAVFDSLYIDTCREFDKTLIYYLHSR